MNNFGSSEKISAYFSHLVSEIGRAEDTYCVAVVQMVPNTLYFAPALQSLVTLSALLAKPKSVDRPEFSILSRDYCLPNLSREWAADHNQVIRKLIDLGLQGKRIVFADIGGYFSASINKISKEFDGQVVGVLEGTENGALKYEKNFPHEIPILTVARSPLKLPEDYLVGSSVVFSIEAVLREQAEILQTRTAVVIGYGRVGSSVAHILRGRGINTMVYDSDPMKLAEAAARGFQASVRLEDALMRSSLVVCATGNRALDLRGFGMLQSGSVVASVTSGDDEFDLDCLDAGYDKHKVSSHLTAYKENRPGNRYFYLIADGNAANFIHGAVIGPAIQLIEGEKLMAIKELCDGSVPISKDRLYELGAKERRIVSEIWIEHFL